MNFLQLRNLVSFWLDDVNQTYFTPTQINIWLNNAQKEVQKLLLQAAQNFYVKPVTTTLISGQTDYVLPQDFLKLHRLEIVVSGTVPNETLNKVNAITLNQKDVCTNITSVPSFYFLKKNRIVLSPAPDSTYTMRMYYSPLVADMVLDTDIPNVPDSYVEMIAIMATLDGFLKDQRDPGPFLEKRRYYEAMMKNDTQERQEDGPRGIVSSESSFDGGWYY